MIQSKVCTKCGQEKLLSEFPKCKVNSDGHDGRCKKCFNEYNRAYYHSHLEQCKKNRRDSFKKRCFTDADCEAMRKIKNRQSRAWKVRQTYGISIDEYESIIASNPNCQLCGKRLTGRRAMDHDHKTGQLRGVLCCACNTGIGKLGDCVEALEKAITYLRNPPLSKPQCLLQTGINNDPSKS